MKLQEIQKGLIAARQAENEEARESVTEEKEKAEEYRLLLEDLHGQILTIQEELDIALK